MIQSIQVQAWECKCELCHQPWRHVGDQPPVFCKFCRSRQWNGKKVKRKPDTGIKMPKPTKVRQQEDEGELL